MRANSLFLTDLVRALAHSKARALFAVLGVIMGIASLVFIVASIEASSAKSKEMIEKLGPDSILIFSSPPARGQFRRPTRILTFSHIKELQRLDKVASVTYGIQKGMEVKSKKESKRVRVGGVAWGWIENWGYEIDEGVPFVESDYDEFRKCVVIGHDLAEFLFGEENPIGKNMVISSTPFKVIGLYKRRGKNPMGENLDQSVFVPLPTYQKSIEQEYKYVSVARVKVEDMAYYDYVEEQVRSVLKQSLPEDKFMLITPTQIRAFFDMLSSGLSIFLALSSVTALVVSGFVLSNIFYINVRVRKWEIGLRRALGATKNDIKMRFLAESVVVTLVGAVLGTIIGFAGVYFGLPLLDLPPVYPIKAFFIALAFSVVLGLISAYAPAREAANYPPIEALRSKV